MKITGFFSSKMGEAKRNHSSFTVYTFQNDNEITWCDCDQETALSHDSLAVLRARPYHSVKIKQKFQFEVGKNLGVSNLTVI